MERNKCDKVTYLEKSKYILENREELIRKRKKKKAIKNAILLGIILISILILLLFKLPYFNIKSIKVYGNSNVPSEEIIDKLDIQIGRNIFNIDTKHAKESILSNPYILNVKIKKDLPDDIKIHIKERKASFYIKNDEPYFYIVDKNGIVLEKRENIKNMNLKRILGVDTNNIKIGKHISVDDKRKLEVIKDITEILYNNSTSINISMLDISNIYDIKVYCKEMCIKLGDFEKLENKMSVAFSILIQNSDLRNKKGYIDVSSRSNPVFSIQK